MNPLAQTAVIAISSLAAAGATFAIRGAPERAFTCDPASLKADEVCLDQIASGASILWVDARPRKDWVKNGVPGSILWNVDAAEDLRTFEAETAMRIMETPQVVVYCGDENCGVSRQVAQQIRDLQLGAEVSVLKGGWRALSEAGRTKRPAAK